MSNFRTLELWKPVPDGAREVLPTGLCPGCRSPRVHRSRVRGPLEYVLRALTPLRAFRCSQCRWRGWRVPIASQGPVLPLPPAVASPARRGTRRNSAGRRIYSPKELAVIRSRRHVALAFLLALGAASTLLYCQQDPPPSAGLP